MIGGLELGWLMWYLVLSASLRAPCGKRNWLSNQTWSLTLFAWAFSSLCIIYSQLSFLRKMLGSSRLPQPVNYYFSITLLLVFKSISLSVIKLVACWVSNEKKLPFCSFVLISQDTHVGTFNAPWGSCAWKNLFSLLSKLYPFKGQFYLFGM